ncbi:sugar ABC transporter substrate-binding protein [Mycolicibacterium phlei]
MTARLRAAATLVATALLMAIAGCGAATTPYTRASVVPTGTLDGQGRTLVAFTVSSANNYVNAATQAMRDQAAALNYNIKIIENSFNQTMQDQQVRQFLASGQDAAAFIYWPATNESGINSSRLLAARAPVIQINSRVLDPATKYVTAYSGVDNHAIGRTMGQSALKSVAAARAAGRKFHGPHGEPNLLEITYPSGYQAGIDRSAGFFDEIAGTFHHLATEHVKTPDAQGGFTAASQIIPKVKSQGIDYIAVGSNNMAVGVVKALVQNGLRPGTDVTVIAGDFSGDKQPLLTGQIESAVLQSPVIDGRLAVQTAAQLLATGEVREGATQIPVAASEPELEMTIPYQSTYMPALPIFRTNYATFRFWGLTLDQLEF